MGRRKTKKRQPSSARLSPPWWVYGCLFLFSSLLYVNTLGHGFVFDDQTLILQNPQVTQLDWAGILGLTTGYRQVRTFTYAVNFLLGGADPTGYHLFNVLLHGINAILVFVLLRSLLGLSHWVSAALGALLFASFPAQTAAVAYISGRKDLLAGFFVLAAFCVYISIRPGFTEPDRKTYRGLGAMFVLFLLAFFSKEVALVFPGVLVLAEWCLDPDRFTRLLRRSGLWVSGVVTSLLLAIAGLAYSVYLTEATRRHDLWGESLDEHIGTAFKLFAHYLKLSVYPHPLIADYTGDVFALSKGFGEVSTLFSVALALGYVLAAIWAFKRSPLVTFAMGWFLLFLLPVLQIIPFHELAADHFLYLPYVGTALLWALCFRELLKRNQRSLGYGVAFIVVGLFSYLTIHRNPVWKNEVTLWSETLERAPNSYRANLNLGSMYFQQSRSRSGQARRQLREKAIELTRRAAELLPDQRLPYGNLGAMYREKGYEYYQRGELQEAEALQHQALEALDKSIEIGDDDPFMYSNQGDAYKDLALIWDARKDPQKAFELRGQAIRKYQKGLEIGSHNPNIAALWFKIGMVFADAGQFSDMNYYLRRAVDEPVLANFAPVHYWSGYAYFLEGDWALAVKYLSRAAQLTGTFEAYWYLARSHERLGYQNGKIVNREHLDAAVQAYRVAIQKNPASLEAVFNVGVLYFRLGDYVESRRFLSQALDMAPESSGGGPVDAITRARVRQMLALLPA